MIMCSDGLRDAQSRNTYQLRTTESSLIFDSGSIGTPFASFLQADYLFTQDSALREAYCTIGGSQIRCGKVIEDLDAIACDCSYKYMTPDEETQRIPVKDKGFYCVTVSFD